MGCESYDAEGAVMKFDECSDEGCLCTWPGNYGETLDVRHLRLLAQLGAAVILQRRYWEEHGEPADSEEDHWFLPNGLPKWFLKELDRILP